MRMTEEEAKEYRGYALTPEQFIKKVKKFDSDLTPEERAEEKVIYEIDLIHGGGRVEVERITIGEFYDRCVTEVERLYEEFKKMKRVYNAFQVCPNNTKFDMSELTESERMVSFLYYLMDNGFSMIGIYPKYPLEVIKMVFWSMPEARKTPKERAESERARRMIEEDKKYIKPGEKDVGYATIAKRKAKANPPQTSLSADQIASFDRMSDKWLARWCNFSSNWLWVCPCLLLCIVANKGLSSAIGLLVFMGAGTWYSCKVQEYCSVILPWYKEAGIMLERRVFNKL